MALRDAFLESGWLGQQCATSNAQHQDAIEAHTTKKKVENLYSIDEFIVKPVTDPSSFQTLPAEHRRLAGLPTPTRQSSYAELINPAGVSTDFFVSHYWGHIFKRTMIALQNFASEASGRSAARVTREPRETVFWICLFALNQHSAGDEVGASPEEGPFNAAVTHASSGAVMVLDEQALPLQRIWCMYEVGKMHSLRCPFEFVSEEGTEAKWSPESLSSLMDSIDKCSAHGAEASQRQDKMSILYRIVDPFRRICDATLAEFELDWDGGYIDQDNFTDFDSWLGCQLAGPLLQASLEKKDWETVLRCVGHGGNFPRTGESSAEALRAIEKTGQNLAAVLVDTKFNDVPQPLASVMAFFGDMEAMQVLSASQSVLGKEDSKGQSPLIWACYKENYETVRFLLECKVDVNHAEEEGEVALHKACVGGNPDLVALLLEHGAFVNVENGHKSTPLLTGAMMNPSAATAKLLLQAGANIMATDEEMWTPLHWAARNNYVELAMVLLDHGADINFKELSGKTPLALAASKGHKEIIASLFDRGAALDTADASGQLPADLAKDACHDEAVKLLESLQER